MYIFLLFNKNPFHIYNISDPISASPTSPSTASAQPQHSSARRHLQQHSSARQYRRQLHQQQHSPARQTPPTAATAQPNKADTTCNSTDQTGKTDATCNSNNTAQQGRRHLHLQQQQPCHQIPNEKVLLFGLYCIHIICRTKSSLRSYLIFNKLGFRFDRSIVLAKSFWLKNKNSTQNCYTKKYSTH